MKHSLCNIQLLPKAADLRKKGFDEFRHNILIALFLLLSRNAIKSWLPSSSFLIPSFPGPTFLLPCLVPRPLFSSRPERFGSRGPYEKEPKKVISASVKEAGEQSAY